MITLKDVVFVKDNKKVIEAIPFQREYFQFGPNDVVKNNVSNANSVEEDGSTKKWSEPIQEPVGVDVKDGDKVIGVKSVHDSQELFAVLVAHLQEKHPLEDPINLILQTYDVANALDQRKEVRPATPAKLPEISAEKAEKRILSDMVRGKIAPDLATAKLMYDAMKGFRPAA